MSASLFQLDGKFLPSYNVHKSLIYDSWQMQMLITEWVVFGSERLFMSVNEGEWLRNLNKCEWKWMSEVENECKWMKGG